MKKEDFVSERRSFAEKPIGELIDLLSSDELQTRFFAEMCLRDATNTWLNFQPASSPQVREKAVEEWRDWWRERAETFKKKWQS